MWCRCRLVAVMNLRNAKHRLSFPHFSLHFSPCIWHFCICFVLYCIVYLYLYLSHSFTLFTLFPHISHFNGIVATILESEFLLRNQKWFKVFHRDTKVLNPPTNPLLIVLKILLRRHNLTKTQSPIEFWLNWHQFVNFSSHSFETATVSRCHVLDVLTVAFHLVSDIVGSNVRNYKSHSLPPGWRLLKK